MVQVECGVFNDCMFLSHVALHYFRASEHRPNQSGLFSKQDIVVNSNYTPKPISGLLCRTIDVEWSLGWWPSFSLNFDAPRRTSKKGRRTFGCFLWNSECQVPRRVSISRWWAVGFTIGLNTKCHSRLENVQFYWFTNRFMISVVGEQMSV